MNAKNQKLLNDDDDLEFLQSLKNDFYTETQESLEKCEASLLNYESTKSELSILDYKRTLHSIKGSAKAVDEADFALLVHKIEDTIAGNKDATFFDINFKFLDFAKNYIDSLKTNESQDAAIAIKAMEDLFKS